MRVAYDTFEFEGEFFDLIEMTKFSKTIRALLGAEKGYAIENGASYTLDSHETWEGDADGTDT